MGFSLRKFRFEVGELYTERIFDFLASFSGLSELYISASMRIETFDVGCLDGHKATLQKFALAMPQNCQCDDDHRCFISPVVRFVKKCPELEEVGLTLPHVALADDVESTDIQNYAKTVTDLISLPKLNSLRIFNWPEAPQDMFIDAGQLPMNAQGRLAKERRQRQHLTLFERAFCALLNHCRAKLSNGKIPSIGFGSLSESLACDGSSHERIPPVRYRITKVMSLFGDVSLECERLSNWECPAEGVWEIRP